MAAGAVITRGDGKNREFLLVHRGYRDDWTFPKGKVDPGEHVVAAAVREVREETGYAIRLGIRLPSREYQVKGTPKVAHYWHGQLVAGEFTPNDEVDQVRWVRLEEASSLLSYPEDVHILKAASAARVSSPFLLLRHTQAVKRSDWAVDVDPLSVVDASRPLTPVGRMQAAALIPVLAAFGVEALHTSDSRRCRDTVGPYASARSLALHLVRAISEERHREQPQAAVDAILTLAANTETTALCTHRPVMATVMDALSQAFDVADGVASKDFDPALTPGSFVVFHRNSEDPRSVMAIERHIRQ